MSKKTFNPDVDVNEWQGGNTPYDIIKEGTIAMVVVLVLTMGLALLFGSPDEKSVTIRQWSHAAPIDFASTAYGELAGTTTSAGYGAPYNSIPGGGSAQALGPLKLQTWVGVHIKVNPARDFVLHPLTLLPDRPVAAAVVATWDHASATQQAEWLKIYGDFLPKLAYVGGHLTSPGLSAGPLPVMMDVLTSMAQTGALDQALVAQNSVYVTNYTKPLLFIADGNWFADLATKQHLSGDQWGMMNETGSYPGQAWLWLYSFWYQISPFNASGNADILIQALMVVLSGVLLLVPFIPGLRAIPRKTKLYRVIWREHYQRSE